MALLGPTSEVGLSLPLPSSLCLSPLSPLLSPLSPWFWPLALCPRLWCLHLSPGCDFFASTCPSPVIITCLSFSLVPRHCGSEPLSPSRLGCLSPPQGEGGRGRRGRGGPASAGRAEAPTSRGPASRSRTSARGRAGAASPNPQESEARGGGEEVYPDREEKRFGPSAPLHHSSSVVDHTAPAATGGARAWPTGVLTERVV